MFSKISLIFAKYTISWRFKCVCGAWSSIPFAPKNLKAEPDREDLMKFKVIVVTTIALGDTLRNDLQRLIPTLIFDSCSCSVGSKPCQLIWSCLSNICPFWYELAAVVFLFARLKTKINPTINLSAPSEFVRYCTASPGMRNVIHRVQKE